MGRHGLDRPAGVETFKDSPTFNPLVFLAFVSVIASVLLIYSAGSGERRTGPSSASLRIPGFMSMPPSPSPSAVPSPSPVVPPPIAVVMNPSPSIAVPPSPAHSRAVPPVAPSRATTTAPPPPPPPPPLPAAVTANYSVRTDWGDGFVADIVVRNPTGAPATWTVELTYTYDVSISAGNTWNASVQRIGATYRFQSTWVLKPGDSVQFGFVASKARTSSVPSRCEVDGRPCS